MAPSSDPINDESGVRGDGYDRSFGAGIYRDSIAVGVEIGAGSRDGDSNTTGSQDARDRKRDSRRACRRDLHQLVIAGDGTVWVDAVDHDRVFTRGNTGEYDGRIVRDLPARTGHSHEIPIRVDVDTRRRHCDIQSADARARSIVAAKAQNGGESEEGCNESR